MAICHTYNTCFHLTLIFVLFLPSPSPILHPLSPSSLLPLSPSLTSPSPPLLLHLPVPPSHTSPSLSLDPSPLRILPSPTSPCPSLSLDPSLLCLPPSFTSPCPSHTHFTSHSLPHFSFSFPPSPFLYPPFFPFVFFKLLESVICHPCV